MYSLAWGVCMYVAKSLLANYLENSSVGEPQRFCERAYMLMVHLNTLENERSIDSSISLRRGSPSMEICLFHVIFAYFISGIVLMFLGP